MDSSDVLLHQSWIDRIRTQSAFIDIADLRSEIDGTFDPIAVNIILTIDRVEIVLILIIVRRRRWWRWRDHASRRTLFRSITGRRRPSFRLLLFIVDKPNMMLFRESSGAVQWTWTRKLIGTGGVGSGLWSRDRIHDLIGICMFRTIIRWRRVDEGAFWWGGWIVDLRWHRSWWFLTEIGKRGTWRFRRCTASDLESSTMAIELFEIQIVVELNRFTRSTSGDEHLWWLRWLMASLEDRLGRRLKLTKGLRLISAIVQSSEMKQREHEQIQFTEQLFTWHDRVADYLWIDAFLFHRTDSRCSTLACIYSDYHHPRCNRLVLSID